MDTAKMKPLTKANHRFVYTTKILPAVLQIIFLFSLKTNISRIVTSFEHLTRGARPVIHLFFVPAFTQTLQSWLLTDYFAGTVERLIFLWRFWLKKGLENNIKIISILRPQTIIIVTYSTRLFHIHIFWSTQHLRIFVTFDTESAVGASCL